MSVQTRGYSGASYTHQSNNLEVVKRVLGGHSPPPKKPLQNPYKTYKTPTKLKTPIFIVFLAIFGCFFLGGGGCRGPPSTKHPKMAKNTIKIGVLSFVGVL